MKKTYKEIWDSTFEKFDLEEIPWLTKGVDKKLSNVIDDQENHVNNVLEIGCGLGYLSEYLSRKYKNVTAIDVSKLMINLCKNNQNTKVKYIEEDFFNYSSSQKFDLIISQLLFHHIEDNDIELFFQKSYDLLQENGILILTFLLSSTNKTEKKESFFYPHTVTYHTMNSVKNLSKKYFENVTENNSIINCKLGCFKVGIILFTSKNNM